MAAVARCSMSELFNEAARVARDAASVVLCGIGGANRALTDLGRKLNPDFRIEALDRLNDRVSDGLQRFCPVPPPPLPPQPVAPFSGGQCSGVFYGVFYNTLSQEFGPDGSTIIEVPGERSTSGFGPIVSVTSSPVGPPASGGFQAYETVLVSNGGATTTSILTGPIRSTGIFRIDRADGQPDDCGDPPPPEPDPPLPPPSNPRPPTITVNIDLPDIGPVDVDFSPTVGPIYVNIDGEIVVPVTVDVELGNFAPSFDIDFEVNITNPTTPPKPIDPRPPRDEDDRPAPPDCPPPPACDEEPEEEDPEEELPETDDEGLPQEVLAATVRVTAIAVNSKATEIFQDENPNIFAPALGFVNFGYKLENGDTVWSKDFPVKNRQMIISAPNTGLRCTQVKGTPNPGVGWNLKAITGRKGCS